MDQVERRFVAEMPYGIQASKDVKVSEVARSLQEDIALIKTENRLCRNLASEDLTGRVNRWTAWEGSGAVEEGAVLAPDLGDVRKNYANKMGISVKCMMGAPASRRKAFGGRGVTLVPESLREDRGSRARRAHREETSEDGPAAGAPAGTAGHPLVAGVIRGLAPSGGLLPPELELGL
jgi:hypothetical protein